MELNFKDNEWSMICKNVTGQLHEPTAYEIMIFKDHIKKQINEGPKKEVEQLINNLKNLLKLLKHHDIKNRLEKSLGV
jgi:hypothetical protein